MKFEDSFRNIKRALGSCVKEIALRQILKDHKCHAFLISLQEDLGKVHSDQQRELCILGSPMLKINSKKIINFVNTFSFAMKPL